MPPVTKSINAIENLNSISIHSQEQTTSESLSNSGTLDIKKSNIIQKDEISETLVRENNHSIDAGPLIYSGEQTACHKDSIDETIGSDHESSVSESTNAIRDSILHDDNNVSNLIHSQE